jgi:hypothetical protein
LLAFIEGGGQVVGRKLFDNEDVVGLVFVEAADDVVAIRPRKRGSWDLRGCGESRLRVTVACRVEPVTPPTLAVVRRVEKAIDDLFKRFWRFVMEKFPDLFRRWGRPMRSNVARRIKVRLSASGFGFNPFSARRATMNLSISVCGQFASWTFGISGLATG